jgi:hypothetical protein
MSNTREIFPLQPIWTTDGTKDAKYLALTDFFGYHFDNGGGTVTYQLIGVQENGTSTLEDGTIVQNPTSLVVLFQSNLQVPSSVVQQWGASDQIMFEYVATTLGLTLVPIIEN